MEITRRTTWKCEKCLKKSSTPVNTKKSRTVPVLQTKKQNMTNTTSKFNVENIEPTTSCNDTLNSLELSMINPIDNITHRKREVQIIRVETRNSFESLADSLQSDTEQENSITGMVEPSYMNRSCPELNNMIVGRELDIMKDKITKLESQLNSAEHEIEIMLSENCKLKKELAEYKKKFDHLKKICIAPNVSKNKVKLNKINKTLPATLEEEIVEEQINTENYSHINIEYRLPQSKRAQAHKKPQICMVSNNKNTKIAQLGFEMFNDEFEYNHFRYPNAGTENLLECFEKLTRKFNKYDYGVLFLGETDFQKTENFEDLVVKINENIRKIVNTNVIICVPTYKYGHFTTLYNSRVEKFNSMLHRNNKDNEYAYLLDSNLHLRCDFEMFNRRDGRINTQGFRIIFHDLKEFVLNLGNYNLSSIIREEVRPETNRFFRE